MLSTDHTLLGPDCSPLASHPNRFPAGLLVVEPQALQGPGEVRGQRSQKLNGWVPGPGAWEAKTVQMEVQGQPGSLGGGQAEAAEEGFIQDLGRRDVSAFSQGSSQRHSAKQEQGKYFVLPLHPCSACLCTHKYLHTHTHSHYSIDQLQLLLSRFRSVRLCATP